MTTKELILVTGCAGFIGSHTTESLLRQGYKVIGIDNLNNYYDVDIKLKNLDILRKYPDFTFQVDNICDTTVISDFNPTKVIHLASMAGVRYSIKNPDLYEKVNIGGFINILQECVKNKVKQIVFASSSSVYGLNTKVPFEEDDPILTCNSPYACSKMAMEIYAKTYSQLYGLSCIGLRFFTVYGPRGRPDMAPYKFIKAIITGKEIEKYGDGTSSRDYTYIDDIVSGIIGALHNVKQKRFEIYNLGNSTPVHLNQFIHLCEKVAKKKALIHNVASQLGDVPHTYACIQKAVDDLDYCPKTTLEQGLQKLYDWMIINIECDL